MASTVNHALCVLLCSGVLIAGSACVAADNDYRAVLDQSDFANYEIVAARDDVARRQEESPGQFDENILVGDFNFDGRRDFAAVLSRKATQAEIDRTYLSPDLDRSQLPAFVAVVCNGLDETSGAGRYQCAALSETVVGAFGGELAVLDPSDWGELSMLSDAAGNARCPEVMPAYADRLLLALDEHLGRCTVYYYPEPNGMYGQCIYCAD